MTDYVVYDCDKYKYLDVLSIRAWKLYPVDSQSRITDERGRSIYSLSNVMRFTNLPSGEVDSIYNEEPIMNAMDHWTYKIYPMNEETSQETRQ